MLRSPGKMKLFFTLSAILTVMFLPALISIPGFAKAELKGAYVWNVDSALTAERWIDGRFQTHEDKYLKENFPTQPFFFRLCGQLRFMLFKEATAYGVIVGYDNFLYEEPYITSYNGKNFSGPSYFRDFATKLKKVDDTLRKLNKLVLLVIAPGKTTYYPEYVPKKYAGPPALNNYTYLSSILRAYRIPFIDFNADFRARKHSSPYPLFPQFGIHWSNYGSLTAFDSICRYIEARLNINVPDLKFRSVEVAQSKEGDNDVINSMNLLWHPRTFKMGYPDYYIEYDSLVHKKPRVIAITDSFWWFLYGKGIPQTIFSDHKFWYYNASAWPESGNQPTSPGEFDFGAEIKKTDVILILYTEANLNSPGSGIVDQLYGLYFGNTGK
jgi:hypothetical protein